MMAGPYQKNGGSELSPIINSNEEMRRNIEGVKGKEKSCEITMARKIISYLGTRPTLLYVMSHHNMQAYKQI